MITYRRFGRASTVAAFGIFVLASPALGAGTAAVVAETVVAGKYKPEHDSSLIDMAAATDFAREHASALQDLRDAGV